jgi:hypothetical protein
MSAPLVAIIHVERVSHFKGMGCDKLAALLFNILVEHGKRAACVIIGHGRAHGK